MSRWFAFPSELRQSGVLGINRRNLEYILETNPRRCYPRVDNKLLTKQVCLEHQIPVPETYCVAHSHSDIRTLPDHLNRRQDFVVKPSRGAAGRGILVVAERTGEVYLTPSGRPMRWSELKYHLATIVSGLHSLGGRPDKAIIEQRIVTHPSLAAVSVGGTPDIRVVLSHGVPVMAMVRLPTSISGGKANLHQGAIAAAIDLTTGRTFGGVCQNRAIDTHPDTQHPIAGIALPDWRGLIDASMRLSDALGLGYLGVDFVIDAAAGPVVLEANARPGLAIQVAHRAGLRPRLEWVRSLPRVDRTPDERWGLIEEMTARTAPVSYS